MAFVEKMKAVRPLHNLVAIAAVVITWTTSSGLSVAQPEESSGAATPSSKKAEKPPASSSAGYTSKISATKDAFNILFFAITSVLAILTYLQAKRTIFTPFRTEAFKLQLKSFEDVLVFFEKHSTTSIDDEFDFKKIVNYNAIKMIDEYMLHFFGNEIDKEAIKKKREPMQEEIAGAVVTENYMAKFFELPTHTKTESRNPDHPTNPAIILAKWQEYEHGMIEFTKRYEETSEKLRRFKVSPLLPHELKEKINQFEDIVEKNLTTIGKTLTKVAKDLPAKYPSSSFIKKVELSWIWNLYNDEHVRLSEKQNEILQFVSEYLQIDKLLPRDRKR